jgi:hypothetical protein
MEKYKGVGMRVEGVGRSRSLFLLSIVTGEKETENDLCFSFLGIRI